MYSPTENESQLWAKLRQGDIQALNELYTIYADSLYDYGTKLNRDPEYVMDSIHDLFLDLYKYRKKLSENVNVKYYLLKALKRNLNERFKSRLVVLSPEEDYSGTIFKNGEASIEEKMIQEEGELALSSILFNGMKGLSQNQQKAISMRFSENRSYEEIAVNMNVSIQTARTTIYRAIKTLRHTISYRV